MSTRNRLLAILLALTMMVTYMPGIAFAETNPDTGTKGSYYPGRFVSGETHKSVTVDNTKTNFNLTCAIPYSQQVVSNFTGYYGSEVLYDDNDAFEITGFRGEPELNDQGEIVGVLTVSTKANLEEGEYYCELYSLYDGTGQANYSARKLIAGLTLEVLSYDPDQYNIDVSYCSTFNVPDQSTTQETLNNEFGMQKDIAITNTGAGAINVSGDSYVIDESASDIDAFIINCLDENKKLEPGESWTGMTVLPKAGMPAGKYTLSAEVFDETGYATSEVTIEYRIGDPLIIESSMDEISFDYDPTSGEPVDGPQECELFNDSNADFANVTVESSNNAFTTEVIGEDEVGNTRWNSKTFLTLVVDVKNNYPTKDETGVITVTATTYDEKTTSLNIPVRLTISDDNSPHFEEYTHSSDAFSKKELSEYDDESGPLVLMSASFNHDKSLDVVDSYYAVDLEGEDVELFDIRLDYNEGGAYVVVVPKDSTAIPVGTYCVSLNLYYDPDGNVTTEAEPADSEEYTFEVYDEEDWRLVLLDENGEAVLDEENKPVEWHEFNLGVLEEGYDKDKAEGLRKTVKLKNAGSETIILDPKYFSGEDSEEGNELSENLDFNFSDGTDGVKELAPGDCYEFSVAPVIGMEEGRYKGCIDIKSKNGRSNMSIDVYYAIVKDGLSVNVNGERNDLGEYVLDMGIDSTNEDGTPEPSALLEINNTGSVPVALSADAAEGSNAGFACGFIHTKGDEYEVFSTLQLDPGESCFALASADYEMLRNEGEGAYSAAYTLTAIALDDDRNQTDQKLQYDIKASYEISDGTREVSFNFKNLGDYQNQTIEVKKGSTVEDALETLFENLEVTGLENLTADGYKCVGYSFNEDDAYESWKLYNKAHKHFGETIVRDDLTIYFDWAQLLDPIEVKTRTVKCGDKVSDAIGSVVISGLNDNCDLESAKIFGSNGNKLSDESVIRANGGSYSYKLCFTPKFGFAIDSLIVDGTEEYEGGDTGSAVISIPVDVCHRINQVQGYNATCEAVGVRNHYECKACDIWFSDRNGIDQIDRFKAAIPAKGHKWNQIKYKMAEDHASCTATAVCERDGEHVLTETIPTTVSLDVNDCTVARTATYTAAFEKPDDPNYPFETQTDSEELPAGEHTWEMEITKAATCTEAGNEHYECSVCGTEKNEKIPELGHDWGPTEYDWSEDYSEVTAMRVCGNDSSHVETETVATTSEITPATCTSKKRIKYTASFENAVFDTQIKTVGEGKALGHDWGAPTYEWSEDNGEVTATRVCGNDSSHVETETVATTSEITPATCTSKKKIKYTASFENAAFETLTKTVGEGKALGHDWGTPTYEWAEDNSTVTATRVCNNDQSHIETETVATTSETTPATCTSKKRIKYTATFENADFNTLTKTVGEGKALGHDWGMPTYEWSADNSTVTATRVCNNDQSHVETETVATTAEVSPATCTSKKKNKYTATFENSAFDTLTKTVGEGKALGHDWGVPTYEWSADYSTVTATRVCNNDSGHIETETVDVVTEVSTATCTSREKIKYTATFDNPEFDIQTKTVSEGKALGHDWGEWGKFDAEQHQRVCANDANHVEKENHNWNNGEVTTEPTCGAEGVRTYTCYQCGETKTSVIEATGEHTADEPVHENEVAETKDEIGHYEEVVYCSICGEEMSRAVKEIRTLHDAKEAAIAELDSVNLAKYSEPEKTKVKNAIDEAKTAIENAESIEDVNTAKETANNTIKVQKTDAQKQEEARRAAQPKEIVDLPVVKISKPKAGKKKATVKWKKVSKKNQKKIQGIEIQVASDPGFKQIVKSTTASKKKKSKTIKGLRPKTTYWVRIRAYKNASNGKHVSVWKVKKVKIKK